MAFWFSKRYYFPGTWVARRSTPLHRTSSVSLWVALTSKLPCLSRVHGRLIASGATLWVFPIQCVRHWASLFRPLCSSLVPDSRSSSSEPILAQPSSCCCFPALSLPCPCFVTCGERWSASDRVPSHARFWGLARCGHDPFPGSRAARHLGLSLCRAFCVRPTLRGPTLRGPPHVVVQIQHPKIGRSRNWPKSKLAEVEIGRSRKWSKLAEVEIGPKSKLPEVEIGRSRNWPKSELAEVELAEVEQMVFALFLLSLFPFFFLLLCLFIFH